LRLARRKGETLNDTSFLKGAAYNVRVEEAISLEIGISIFVE
jgi:hypothetical protein